MARLLALEWDAREARVVIARARGSDVVIEEAFSIELAAREEDAVHVGPRLAAVLAKFDVRRAETLVAVGRANIELRVLSLPPAPAEELPGIVRFQALKQFTTMGDEWPLDYIPLDGGLESQNVLAAAISPELVQQIRETCRAVHVDPKRLVLRPFAAASLWRRHARDQRCTLMIDMLIDEADLTVLADGQVVFTRTVRLSLSGDEELSRGLIGEIRRTIAAAHNQLAGQRVERVIFCGDNEAHATLREQVQHQISLAVEYFDPFSNLDLAGGAAAVLPEHPGRYAPLLGLVAMEAAGERPSIDFLNPRKRPVPVRHNFRNGLLAAAASVLVLIVAGWGWLEFRTLNRQISRLTIESKTLDDNLKRLKAVTDEVERVDEFTRSDVNWLDELYRLSNGYLPASDAVVSEMNFLAGGKMGGGSTTIEGFVRQSNLIEELQGRLRDERHAVSNSGSSYDEKQELYRWRYTESIVIAAEDPELRFVPPDNDSKTVPKSKKLQPTSPSDQEPTTTGSAPADATPVETAPAQATNETTAATQETSR